MSSMNPHSKPELENYPSSEEKPNSEAPPETAIHESRLASTPESYQDPDNHLFRKKYRQLSMQEAKLMDDLKDKANEINALIQSISMSSPEVGRCKALAKTNLEQSIMWAVKGITA